MNGDDPIKKMEAQTILRNMSLKIDLANLNDALNRLFTVHAPELKQITTADELKGLMDAVRAGTAANHQLARFIEIGSKVLRRL